MLALSVVSLGLSYTTVEDFLGGALKPLAAIFFIVFFIVQLMKDKVKQYDQEHEESLRRATAATSTPEPVRHEQSSQDNQRPKRLRPRHRFRQHQPRRRSRDNRLEEQVQG